MAVMDFPPSPSIGQNYPSPAVPGQPVYTWDGEKWVQLGGVAASPSDALPLMDATPALAGSGSHYSREDHRHPSDTSRAPFDAMAYSGMQVNGGMEVSQENGATPVVIAGTAKNIVDGFGFAMVGSGASLSGFQTPISSLPGFPSCLTLQCNVANPLGAAGDQSALYQYIEGYRIARLGWGTANAQPLTIGFWVLPNIAGTMTVAVKNGGNNRSYVVEVPVTSAGWQYKTVTIPGDTTGTWNAGNSYGISVFFCFGAGSSFKGAANTWLAANVIATAATTNFFATTGTIYFTGVTVLPGNEAPSAARSPFIMRPYDQELVSCQRYYRRIGGAVIADVGIQGYTAAGLAIQSSLPLSPAMRAAPTATAFGTFNTANCGAPTFLPGNSCFSFAVNATVTGGVSYFGNIGGFALDARL